MCLLNVSYQNHWHYDGVSSTFAVITASTLLERLSRRFWSMTMGIFHSFSNKSISEVKRGGLGCSQCFSSPQVFLDQTLCSGELPCWNRFEAFTLEVWSETEDGLHGKYGNVKAVMCSRKRGVLLNPRLPVGASESLVALELYCESCQCEHDSYSGLHSFRK